MPKKKNTKTNDVVEQFMKVPNDEVQFGTPPAALLPARNFPFKVLPGEHKITVPRQGKYNELAPDIFKEEDGSFMLFDEESNTMFLPALTKVLFGTSKYPDLQGNQLFLPLALVFNEDTVDIIGQVIVMLQPADDISSTASE